MRVQTHTLSDDGRACAHTSHRVHLSADNNFFATSVAFWRRRDVQRFLHAIDRKSLIYTHRMNDILWQSSTVQIFLAREQVALLDDFTCACAPSWRACCGHPPKA